MDAEKEEKKYNGKLEIASQGETDADMIPLSSQADHEVHHVSYAYAGLLINQVKTLWH